MTDISNYDTKMIVYDSIKDNKIPLNLSIHNIQLIISRLIVCNDSTKVDDIEKIVSYFNDELREYLRNKD